MVLQILERPVIVTGVRSHLNGARRLLSEFRLPRNGVRWLGAGTLDVKVFREKVERRFRCREIPGYVLTGVSGHSAQHGCQRTVGRRLQFHDRLTLANRVDQVFVLLLVSRADVPLHRPDFLSVVVDHVRATIATIDRALTAGAIDRVGVIALRAGNLTTHEGNSAIPRIQVID